MNLLASYFVSQSKLINLGILTTFPHLNLMTVRSSHNKKSKYYSKSYKILELPEDADQESVRRAYINLCKKYHPDSGKPTACRDKFQEIDDAYKTLQNKFAEERWNVNEGIGEYGLYYDESKKKSDDEVKIFDIKHNAPQHRQYLSFGGYGSGTPSQRQKQFVNYQRMTAIENVYNHRIKKLETQTGEQSLVVKDKTEAKKIKTSLKPAVEASIIDKTAVKLHNSPLVTLPFRYGMERLVEDLIQESMAKGEFDNLRGAGKPLPESNYNPYVDFVTHKMNQVMIENGFVPEWITLQKEITEDVELIREKLVQERRELGPLPLTRAKKQRWEHFLHEISDKVNVLNKKIDKYNLLVPILDKQKLRFNLDKESISVLEDEGFLKGDTTETDSNTTDTSVYIFRQ